MLLAGPIEPAWVLIAFPLLAVLYMLAGVVAWWRRPSNRVGAILLLGSWFLLLAGLINTEVSAFIAVGQITATLPFAVIIHLVVVYPTGRATSTHARVLIALGYIAATLLQAPQYLFAPSPAPTSPLQIADVPALFDAGLWVQRCVGLAIVAATAVHVGRRLRGQSAAVRRVVAPVAGYGLVAVVIVPLSATAATAFGIAPVVRFAFQATVLGIVPLAFALGVLVGGFARTGDVLELGAWLGEDRRRPELQAVLAEALGDPTVQLVFWLTDRARYVDADGQAVESSVLEAAGTRRHEPIELDGRRLGAIAYDPSTIADPDMVRTAGRVVAFAIDRQRLVAELLASRDALRESRARIVEAGEHERRRISRDLHDGLQSRLVLLAIIAQQLVDDVDEGTREGALALCAGLDTAIHELRQLVHGVLPALLLERGLAAATTELTDRMPVPTDLDADDRIGRLPPAVESAAYFVVVEGLTNAMKHSQATHVEVRLNKVGGELCVEVRDDGVGAAVVDGGGLRGLMDRLDALGGRLAVESRAGEGTSVRAVVPCGS